MNNMNHSEEMKEKIDAMLVRWWENIDITPEQMDELHSKGEITIDGTKITYEPPKNPTSQDESL